jgi:hypothetical protein
VRRALVLIALMGLAASPAAAQVVSQRPDHVSVVLYQDHAPAFHPLGEAVDGDEFDDDPGLAVVSETRTVDLPTGRTRISFRGVADGMVAQTAAIEGVDGRLIERNYDFDLLSPGSLIEKAVGAQARLVRRNSKTGQATEEPVTVRSGPLGVILQHADGSAEALGCSGLPETLVFDRAPPGLTATPTLSAEVETRNAGRHVIRLTYLATGLRWRADYVARLAPDGRTLSLHGWLTLSNVSGATFGDAPTQVVAGRLAREGEDEPIKAEPSETFPDCWPIGFRFPHVLSYSDNEIRANLNRLPQFMAGKAANDIQEVIVTGSRIATVSNLGDYKLYTLPEPTTVAANQTKQVAFLEEPAVRYQRVETFEVERAYSPDPGTQQATVLVRFQNKVAEGLGKPLPGGAVTVFEPKGDGGVSLDGQPRVQDTPVGQPVKLAMGASDLVTLNATQGALSYPERGGQVFERSEVAVTVHNAGAAPALVEVKLHQSDLKFLSESRPHTRDGPYAVWTIQVPAEGDATFRYRTEALNSPVEP